MMKILIRYGNQIRNQDRIVTRVLKKCGMNTLKYGDWRKIKKQYLKNL